MPVDIGALPAGMGVDNASGGETVEYLQSLEAVRERCQMVLQAGLDGKLTSFTVHPEKLTAAAEMIQELIRRDYGPIEGPGTLRETLQKIPPHGRWRHFGQDNLDRLIRQLRTKWHDDRLLVTRSILDLFTVAVLLDAGAGDAWVYRDGTDAGEYRRSEGLAVAALRMFEAGLFSSDPANPHQVDGRALAALCQEDLARGLQVTRDNPLLGVEGRLQLLRRLGGAVEEHPKYFPRDAGAFARPGSLLDYLLDRRSKEGSVNLDDLWQVVIKGLGGVWPASRTRLHGTALGDVWPCVALGEVLVPFHKLSQWLTYSLTEPISKLMGVSFCGTEKMTGLAEYRNGGFLLDMGAIQLRPAALREGLETAQRLAESPAKEVVPLFPPDHQVIVEWRALTVALLDRLAILIRDRLAVGAADLPLANILEAGTWKAGRETARRLRPATCSPPIAIISDGTLF